MVVVHVESDLPWLHRRWPCPLCGAVVEWELLDMGGVRRLRPRLRTDGLWEASTDCPRCFKVGTFIASREQFPSPEATVKQTLRNWQAEILEDVPEIILAKTIQSCMDGVSSSDVQGVAGLSEPNESDGEPTGEPNEGVAGRTSTGNCGPNPQPSSTVGADALVMRSGASGSTLAPAVTHQEVP